MGRAGATPLAGVAELDHALGSHSLMHHPPSPPSIFGPTLAA